MADDGRKALRASGCCVRCGRKSKGYKCTLCAAIKSADSRAYYQRVKAAGRCVRCRNPREQPQRSLCNKHLAELLAKQLERNRKNGRSS